MVERAHETARQGATHEEAKPENDKDTRALEQSYVARGQAMRVEEARAGVAEAPATPVRDFAESDPVALGALVVVEEEGEQRAFFLAPHGGGTQLASATVQVVTPKSPIGRALTGRRAGDDCEVVVAGVTRELHVVLVR